MNKQVLSDIARKKRVFSHALETGNITKTCRYFGIKVSSTGVYYVRKRHGLNRFPNGKHACSMKTYKRYEKQVPGHRVSLTSNF